VADEDGAGGGGRRLLTKLQAYGRVLPKGRRNRTDLVRWLVRRPPLLAAVGTYEVALAVSSRVDSGLKQLAQLRVAALIGCPF
jgi:alkylhydroperoxidase family enzyme